ncbi:MAG: ATP-binding protein [Thermomicrobiales bacterium]|nr:ATP-binding protein [Thermomicrobiales bacterium]MCO5225078.1 ATP-binding protein [Thermomicrobiales bacterium]MCO5228130.1 ATP-binding protein [Thermomicrobiales bacterium]
MMRTVRARLTLTYAALFLITGTVLIALMYVMLSSALEPPPKPKNDNPKPDQHYEYTMPGNEDEWQQQLESAKGEQREEALRQVKISAAIALAVASVGALGVGWVFAGRMLRPVRDITEHAQEASESTLDRRINLQGPDDELKELADTIDAMLARLEQSFQSQKRFAAQASHELRTPLAIMGGEADVTLAEADSDEHARALASVVRAQVDRSERLVEGLLVLARSDSSVINRASLDLADLAGDALEDVIAIADRAHIEIDLDLETARVSGDAVLLRSLLTNLYLNAIQYNRDGGWMRVSVRKDGEHSLIRIENSGDLVSQQDLDRLFQPFQRGLDQADRKQGGFGLGMAIVRSVTAAHDGEIHANARESGGLDFTVRFATID